MELRYDVHGRCAVRVSGDGPAAHVVAAPPVAPWVLEARCGTARGWLLAAEPPEQDAQPALELEVARRTAAARERQVTTLAALHALLVERLTHRLRTDVMTLGTVAEGALEGLFDDEATDVAAELRRTSQEAQRRLTAAREVMSVLDATSAPPERIVATLRAELEGAGRETVPVTGDEDAWTAIGGAGWAACARILAADDRWTRFAIAPDEAGWRVTATARGDAAGGAGGDDDGDAVASGDDAVASGDDAAVGDRDAAVGGDDASSRPPLPWADRSLGDLVRAAHIVVAAGGHAVAYAGGAELVLPAAVP